METVCQINFSLMSAEERQRAEPILRDYLLRAADQVSMTIIGSSSISIFSFIPHGFQFRRFERLLKKDDVAAKDPHYWMFNLTDNIKNLLNQATLLFDGTGRFFYGFSDPQFFKGNKEIASMISNEKLLNLFIPDGDKAELASKGVYLDSPEI